MGVTSLRGHDRADLGVGYESTIAFGKLGACWSHVATQDANIHRMDGQS